MMQDSLLDQMLAPPTVEDPLDRQIKSRIQRQALAPMVERRDPEKAAQAARIARSQGLPTTTVERNLPQFLDSERAQKWQRALEQAPRAGSWLAKGDNAAIASDDHDAIGLLGQAWQGVANVGKSLKSGLYSTSSNLYGGVRAAAVTLEQYDPMSWAQKELFGTSVAEQVRLFAERGAIAAEAEAERARPRVENYYARNLLAGVESVPATIVGAGIGLMGMPQIGLGFIGGVTAGGAYNDAREAGLPHDRAVVYGIAQGTVEYATEMIPMSRLLGDIANRTPFFKTFARQLAAELPQEQVATVLQDLNEWAALHPDKPFSDYLAARPGAMAETALATIGGAAGNASLARAFTVAVKATEKVGSRRRAAEDAEREVAALDVLSGLAEKSRTRTRDPQAFAALMEALGEDAPDTVYVPAGAVREYLQSDDGYDQTFWNQYEGQITEAEATGGDVAIPVSDALTYLPGKAWEALKADVRLSPGGASMREAESYQENADALTEEAAATVSARMAEEDAADAPRQRLFDTAYARLTNAGFTPDAARQYATLVAQREATRAERSGRTLTGMEYATEIRRIMPEALGPMKTADGLDMVVSSMRKRVNVKGPETLVAWLKKGGGIRDTGGELAAMGAPDSIIIKNSSNQPSFLGPGDNSRSIDVVARDAVEAGFLQSEDVQALLDAIEAEIAGTATTRLEDAFAGEETERVREAADALEQLLNEAGLDPQTATDAEIRAAVSRYDAAVEEYGYAQSGGDEALEQSYMDSVRGRFIPGGKPVIELFQSANLSTFLHETGHQWLEELRDDATDPHATDQVRADWRAVQDWFAANGHPVREGEIPVEAHEMWARGVERFAMEGKAPSGPLRSAFNAFRSWLISIYTAVQNLRAPITPEIRDVMARLIATDAEISEAAEAQNIGLLFSDAAAAGMTEAQFAAYKGVADEARTDAYEALLYKTMRVVRAARTKEYQDQRQSVRREIAEMVNSRPQFRAMAILQDKENGVRLDRDWLVETYGSDALDMIPKGVPPLYAKAGTPADMIAEMSGYQTADEMVRALMGIEAQRKKLRARDDKRSVRDSVIDAETDAIMRDRYGDPLSDGTIEREARELIHNDRQGEVIAAELRALSKMRRAPSDPKRTPTPYAVARRWAERKVAEGRVVDYASRAAIQRFQRAARKAGAAAEKAMLAGNVDETFRHKQAQMLNNALVSEATKAADAVETALSKLSKVAKRRTMKTVDQDYLEQAQALLEQVELRQRSQVSINRQGAFEAWAREQEAQGVDVVVPASFEASLGTEHYSRLTVEKFLGLNDAVTQIMHLGRKKKTLLDGKERRDFDAVIAEMTAATGKLPPKPPKGGFMDPTWFDNIKARVAEMDAALLKMETVFDWLDGSGKGVFNRVVFAPIAEAQANEKLMLKEYSDRLAGLLHEVPRDTIKRWAEKVQIPLIDPDTGLPAVMTRDRLVAMALNMGNEGNIQRLTDGYGWSEQGVRDILTAELTEAEWQYVQGVWDVLETLWPEIAKLERSVNGVAPEKVEAKPVETPFGTLRGGYYPAIYDPVKSVEAEERAAKSGDLFENIYTRATTRASASKDRAAKVSHPIHLSLGVIQRHVGEVIHDLTHREAIMQADRFLHDKRVMKAVDETLGPAIRKQFRPWLQHIANEWAAERAGNAGFEKFLKKMRTNATVVGMGYRVSTIMMQIAGYSNTFEVVGARWVVPAIARAARNPEIVGRFVLERSAEVRDRMGNLDRDIRDTIRAAQGSKNPLSETKRFAFYGIGMMDRVVVIPTWLGAYNKALASGAEEQAAIYAADKAVRQSQGAGAAKDLAAVQRGTGKAGEAMKLLTMFYSYMSAVYQRQRTLGRDVSGAVRERRVSDLPNLMARAWWLMVLPPLLSELLAGRGPDEDEDWSLWAFQQMLSQALGPIPLVRDASGALISGFGYKFTPAARGVETIINTAKDVKRIAEGEETKRATRNALETVGYATGLVPGQFASSAQFLVDVGYGEQDPDSVSEWAEGLTKGKIKEE